jgi:hypothetical protein
MREREFFNVNLCSQLCRIIVTKINNKKICMPKHTLSKLKYFSKVNYTCGAGPLSVSLIMFKKCCK